jgi:hypothetical protein
MVVLVIFLSALCIIFCSLFVRERILRIQRERDIRNLTVEYQQEFQNFIYELNHSGPIKSGTTIAGLTRLTSLAVKRTIAYFVDCYEKKEWNTINGITELQEIDHVELAMLRKQFDLFLEAWRTLFKEFDDKMSKDKNET